MDALDSLEQSQIEPVRISTFLPSDFERHPWPVQPGDYQVFQPKAPIAVALLGRPQDLNFDSFSSFPNVAVAGSLTTENLGIEHILKNVIANPFIRHMILFGRDVKGHLPGDALIKLKDEGIAEGQRIRGAVGARPVLKNLLASEIEHFRKQVTVHNLVSKEDFTLVAKTISMLSSSRAAPFETGLRLEFVEVTEAKPSKKLQLDPEGYFVVMATRGNKNPIYVEHYKNDGRLMHIIEGEDATTVCSTIIRMGLVSQIDHAAYLGRELAKAEISLMTGQRYIQDRAQGNLECG